jgi:hypothetical protein
MTIRPRPLSTQRLAQQEAFLSGAPDSAPAQLANAVPALKPKGQPKGHKRQITITLAPHLLAAVDEAAVERGVSRTAFIAAAIYESLRKN